MGKRERERHRNPSECERERGHREGGREAQTSVTRKEEMRGIFSVFRVIWHLLFFSSGPEVPYDSVTKGSIDMFDRSEGPRHKRLTAGTPR